MQGGGSQRRESEWGKAAKEAGGKAMHRRGLCAYGLEPRAHLGSSVLLVVGLLLLQHARQTRKGWLGQAKVWAAALDKNARTARRRRELTPGVLPTAAPHLVAERLPGLSGGLADLAQLQVGLALLELRAGAARVGRGAGGECVSVCGRSQSECCCNRLGTSCPTTAHSSATHHGALVSSEQEVGGEGALGRVGVCRQAKRRWGGTRRGGGR